jgi:predicted enzyme related to lactoylglutathione lyase
MRYRGFIWAGLLVADLDKAISFYRDVLGLPLIERDKTCALLDAGGGALFELWPTGIASSSAKTPSQQSLRIALRVDDLDDAVSRLKGKGVQFLGEIGEYEGTRWINFIDPEGNRLELKEVPRT